MMLNRKARRAMKGKGREFEVPPTEFPAMGKIFPNGEVAFFPEQLKSIMRELGFENFESLLKGWALLGLLKTTPGKGYLCDTEVGGKIKPMYRFAAGVLSLPE